MYVLRVWIIVIEHAEYKSGTNVKPLSKMLHWFRSNISVNWHPGFHSLWKGVWNVSLTWLIKGMYQKSITHIVISKCPDNGGNCLCRMTPYNLVSFKRFTNMLVVGVSIGLVDISLSAMPHQAIIQTYADLLSFWL